MNPFEEKAEQAVRDCPVDHVFEGIGSTLAGRTPKAGFGNACATCIAKALQAEYLRGRETMREDILTTLKDYCVTPYPLMPQAENHWWYEAIDNFKKKFIEYVRQPRSHQGD